MTVRLLAAAAIFVALIYIVGADDDSSESTRILRQASGKKRERKDPRCRGRYGMFPIPEDESCTSYLVCRRGKAIVRKCPDGRRFDSVNYCTEGEADCGRIPLRRSEADIPCPESHGNFSIPMDCKHYFSCSKDTIMHKRCPDGLAFDFTRRECVPAEEVDCDGLKATNDLLSILRNLKKRN